MYMLKLNDNKTELMLVSSNRTHACHLKQNSCLSPPTELMLVTSNRTKHLHNLPTSITIGNAQIPFKQSVKNLVFALDCHLTMNPSVSNIARTCYFELCRLASICRFLTSTATSHLYLLLFCKELTTVTHCCLALLCDIPHTTNRELCSSINFSPSKII